MTACSSACRGLRLAGAPSVRSSNGYDKAKCAGLKADARRVLNRPRFRRPQA